MKSGKNTWMFERNEMQRVQVLETIFIQMAPQPYQTILHKETYIINLSLNTRKLNVALH